MNADSNISGNYFQDDIVLAKGIGIFLVVIGHHAIVGQPQYWTGMVDVIYTFHMPLFMLLSGYLYGLSARKINSVEGYFLFIKKKMQRLIIPYFVITAFFLILKYPAEKYFVLAYPIDKNLWFYILLNPDGGFSYALWFIYTLFVIFLIFPLLKALLRVDLLLLVLSVFLFYLKWPETFCLNHVFHFLPFFTLGYVFKKYVVLDKIRPFYGFVTSMVLFILIILIKSILSTSTHNLFIYPLILGFSGALMIFFLCRSATIKKGGLFYKAFYMLGIYSSAIYLTHAFFTGPARIFFYQVLGVGQSMFLPVVLVVCTAGLLAPIFLEKFLISPRPLLAKFVFGVSSSTK